MNRLHAGLVFAIFWLSMFIAMNGQTQRFRVMTYNVENLFDTCHDVGFDDFEFLPEAERQWNTPRYWAKQGRLARVIAAVGGDVPVDLVGLCEVENDTVLNDLCRRTNLNRLGYEYLMTRSKDVRGLDVALLYQPMRFKPMAVNIYAVPYNEEYGRHTRDILHVTGLLQNGDTLDVFVCHLPSRRGDSKTVDDYRTFVARTLREHVDSVLTCRVKPAVVVMGDFNDEYTDRCIAEGLKAQPVPEDSATVAADALYVLSAKLRGAKGIRGTYKYQGQWSQLDQIVVNGALLQSQATFRTRPSDCRIYAPDFLFVPDGTRGGVKLKRTYQGPIYKGGFSDHFPLVTDFWF